jgi:phage shock protein A
VPDERSTNDVVRLLAAWALLHDSADDAWTAAVRRGRELAPGQMEGGADAFADGLAALVAEEKDRLRERLATGETGVGEARSGDLAETLEALRFEVAELRGRIESLQASVDALSARDEA